MKHKKLVVVFCLSTWSSQTERKVLYFRHYDMYDKSFLTNCFRFVTIKNTCCHDFTILLSTFCDTSSIRLLQFLLTWSTRQSKNGLNYRIQNVGCVWNKHVCKGSFASKASFLTHLVSALGEVCLVVAVFVNVKMRSQIKHPPSFYVTPFTHIKSIRYDRRVSLNVFLLAYRSDRLWEFHFCTPYFGCM